MIYILLTYALIGAFLAGFYHLTDKNTTSIDQTDALIRLILFIPIWPLLELAEFLEWWRLKLRGFK